MKKLQEVTITERKNGSLRVQHNFDSTKTIVDQSYKKDSDVNELVKRWKKTGILAEKGQKQFLDLTQMPNSFVEAHEVVENAWSYFNALPSEIRKAMGNNPANLEEYLNDPKNKDTLVQYGIIEHKDQKQPSKANPEVGPTSDTKEDTKAVKTDSDTSE